MVVGIAIDDDSTNDVTAVTYNGDTLTEIGAVNHSSGGDGRVELWYMVSPDSGTHTVQATVTTSSDEATGGAITLTGVDQSSPVNVHGGTSGSFSSDLISQSLITTVPNTWLVDIVTSDSNLGSTAGGSQTERWDETPNAGFESAASTRAVSTATTTTQSWTNANASGGALYAAAFKPATLPGGGGETSTTTTYYPSSLYEVTGATTTKHIYAGDTLVATIEEDTPDAGVYQVHVDHLNSTSVVTDEIGYLDQVLSYHPFGSSRIDEQYGELNQSNRFTGHEYDEETELSYMGARYQDGKVGRFISQDTWAGDLRNPQSLNKYSFAYNNPILFVDPDGSSPDQTIMLTFNQQHPVIQSMILNEIEGYRQATVETGKTIVGGSIIAGGILSGVATPIVIGGALTNASVSLYKDLQDNGQIDRNLSEYEIDAIVGGTAARIFGKNNFLDVTIGSSVESLAGQLATDDQQVDQEETFVDVSGSFGGKVLGDIAKPYVRSAASSEIAAATIDSLSNLVVKLSAYVAFLQDKKAEDEKK